MSKASHGLNRKKFINPLIELHIPCDGSLDKYYVKVFLFLGFD